LTRFLTFQAEEEGKQKDKNIEQLNEDLQQQDEAIAKISKAKKAVEEQCQVGTLLTNGSILVEDLQCSLHFLIGFFR
jgi:hypothetical protein